MKIEEIKIKNYRSLHDVTIRPRDILALVGKNNTGKSNILKALKFFFDGTTKDINSECFFLPRY
jgi:putative ATP-dependent endonuclease of OLD family